MGETRKYYPEYDNPGPKGNAWNILTVKEILVKSYRISMIYP